MLVLLVAEAMTVAEASGVRLVAFDEYDPTLYRKGAKGDRAAIEGAMTAVSRFYRMHTKVKSGIWRDLVVRKRQTEVDSQLGVVTAKARRCACTTPASRSMPSSSPTSPRCTRSGSAGAT